MRTLTFSSSGGECRNPILRRCEDETHTPKMGTWESFGTPKTSEFAFRVKTTHIGVFFMSLESYQNVNVENGLAWSFEKN